MQTGSIISSSSVRSSVRTKYKVAEGSRNEKEAEESSWSDTEDEAEKSSQKDKKGINTISGQLKNCKSEKFCETHPRQGAWVHLVEGSWLNSKNDFLFPILFNTILKKICLLQKAGV